MAILFRKKKPILIFWTSLQKKYKSLGKPLLAMFIYIVVRFAFIPSICFFLQRYS